MLFVIRSRGLGFCRWCRSLSIVMVRGSSFGVCFDCKLRVVCSMFVLGLLRWFSLFRIGSSSWFRFV